jgi:type I restriction enzyme S subunit
MAVMEGYKQTEVGVIPQDWDVDSIVNLAAITTGDKNTQDRIEDGAYPFFVRSSTVERINSYTFDGEAVLTAGDGVGTGKIFHYINGKFDFHQRVYKISDFGERLDGYYFYLYFSNHFYPRIMQMTAKSSVDSVRREMIANMRIPLPPPAEQEAIAEALSDADALIESLEQLIAKKRDLKQAAMQQLLTGQTRLPGFSGEWEVKPLGKYLAGRPSYGINAAAVPYSDNLPVYIRITDISEDGRFSPDKLVSVKSELSGNYYLSDGDIVFARTGASVGKSYRYDPNDGPLVFAGFLIRARPDVEKLLPDFAAAYVTTGNYWRWVRLMSMRSGQPGINGNEYSQLPIPVPPLPEQRAIATVLSDMDAELAALEARRDKTRALKQGMMQELLTGRIRLV